MLVPQVLGIVASDLVLVPEVLGILASDLVLVPPWPSGQKVKKIKWFGIFFLQACNLEHAFDAENVTFRDVSRLSAEIAIFTR